MHICVGLFFIHLCEGGEELLEMLCRGRIAMRSLGPVNEGHLEAAVVLVVLPQSWRRSGVEVMKEQHYTMVFVVCQEVESLLRISTLVSNRHKASFNTTAAGSTRSRGDGSSFSFTSTTRHKP